MPSRDRLEADAMYPAELVSVDAHVSGTVGTSTFLIKPSKATHIKLQAITQNLRYTIDGSQATSTVGFQLAAGADCLIPVPNNGISLAEESSGALYQAQWVR